MKFQFEANLKHQDEAINSVVDIFNGIKTRNGAFSISSVQNSIFDNGDTGVSNTIQTQDWVYHIAKKNVRDIQIRNNLHLTNVNEKTPTFDIEMETGTGKTYVFLKTILTLNQKYNFKKFIIVVPSVAIREGIKKALEMTHDHFNNIFRINYRYREYDGEQLTRVSNFAKNDNVEILITTIHAFNKKANKMNNDQESLNGSKPIDLIRETNPIIIIDEPQTTASTDKSIEAIYSLNPLFILRYSATFRERVNETLIYSLDSKEAYEQHLVKKIDVYGTEVVNNSEAAYIKIKNKPDIKKQQVEIEIKVANKKGDIEIKSKKIKHGDELDKVSGLSEYKDLKVENINFEKNIIEFSNGRVVKYEELDIYDSDIKREQIKKTIKTHLDKQLKLKKHGIKVLSLFFIDRVSKYRDKDEEGNQKLGQYGQWFEEEFFKILKNDKKYLNYFFNKENVSDQEIKDLISSIHGGYFSVDNKNNLKDTKGSSESDASTYDKIMKDKEKLISFDEKLAFIFSHSALKEGWDNPNVFQICALNESKSEIKRRQEIGRGLRLCVDQKGERIHDENLNVLSVFVKETYKEFIDSLQKEMKEDGVKFNLVKPNIFANEEIGISVETSRKIFELLKSDENGIINKQNVVDQYNEDSIKNILNENGFNENQQAFVCKKLKETNKDISKMLSDGNNKPISNSVKEEVIKSQEFQDLWNKINAQTSYKISFESDDFIKNTIKEIKKSLDEIKSRTIRMTKAGVDIKSSGIEAKKVGVVSNLEINDSTYSYPLIDIISDIQNSTNLTRKTIVSVLSDREIVQKIKENVEQTKTIVTKAMQNEKQKLMVDGIEYTKNNNYYDQKLLKLDGDTLIDIDKVIDSKDSDKYPYQYIEYDPNSNIEKDFANDALNAQIKKFIKLPRKFVIKTPLGKYNPDWALYDDNGAIFVAETKGTNDKTQLRESEKLKIECAKKHFKSLEGKITYKQVIELADLGLNKEVK